MRLRLSGGTYDESGVTEPGPLPLAWKHLVWRFLGTQAMVSFDEEGALISGADTVQPLLDWLNAAARRQGFNGLVFTVEG